MEDYINGIILGSVFTSDQFVADYVKDCDCWVVKHNDNNIHDYWVISYDFDINKQDNIFKNIHKARIADDPSFNKNLSLLLVKKMDNIDLTTVDESIIEIENDSYYFKKYVLAYTQDSSQQLFNLLSKDYRGISLSAIMMMPKSFSKLKEENVFGPYHLLYSLAHKVPFLAMDIKPKNYDEVAKLNIKEEDKLLMDSIDGIDLNNGQDIMRRLVENEEEL